MSETHRLNLSSFTVLVLFVGLPPYMILTYAFFAGMVGLPLGFLSIFLIAVDGVVVARYLRHSEESIGRLADRIRKLSNGDLAAPPARAGGSAGPHGAMIGSLDQTTRGLSSTLMGVVEKAVDLAGTSFEAVATVSRITLTAETQESQAHSISTASQEMAATVLEIARNSGEAAAASKTASQAVSEGNDIVGDTIQKIEQIAQSVQEASDTVKKLGESSERIGEITSVIGDIADQTNLLALNAAIEAARAGDQGRGFAVVADEVRKLAERTAKATQEIGMMIRAIQSDTTSVVETMRTGVITAQSGKEAAHRAGGSLRTILSSIDTVDSMVHQIATASEEQSAASEEIANSIGVIAQMTTGSREEIQRVVDLLDRMAARVSDQLKDIDRFNIPDKILVVAKSDHLLWKKRLNDLLLGRTSLRPDEVADHRACRLGKWYYDAGKSQFGSRPEFMAIEEPHAKIHEIARRVAALWQAGKKEEAQRAVESIGGYTEQVLTNLDRLRSA